MTMDVDDFDHFPVEPSQKGEDGGFLGVTQGEILLHVFEERLLMKGDREAYEQSHLACFLPDSYQNRLRLQRGFDTTICYFDKHGDEATGCFEFHCYDRCCNKTVISEIQAGKSSYVEQWRNYIPSLKQTRFEKFVYNSFVEENFQGFYDNLLEQAKTGNLDQTETFKTFYWVSERERIAGNVDQGKIEEKQVALLGPILLGLFYKKGYDSLLARWRLASGESSISTWRDKKKARELISDTCTKSVQSSPYLVVTKNLELVTDMHVFFRNYIENKKQEVLALMTRKCESLGIHLSQEEKQNYFEDL
eukprot:TRINITY_DN2161_c0_g1_i3.p1 TRINITY_DN2161_c0_g1~~TRINITY_DN2161_c0_g1_i3.p1  ORF type:complete len:306 (+),score=51.35 TRINITY_DN2161_c0_g1_i3:673-1590(+)